MPPCLQTAINATAMVYEEELEAEDVMGLFGLGQVTLALTLTLTITLTLTLTLTPTLTRTLSLTLTLTLALPTDNSDPGQARRRRAATRTSYLAYISLYLGYISSIGAPTTGWEANLASDASVDDLNFPGSVRLGLGLGLGLG